MPRWTKEQCASLTSRARRQAKGSDMPTFPIREFARGLGFVEGPLSLPDGRLLFTDLTSNAVQIHDPETQRTQMFAYTRGGPNGLAVGPDGCFYLCNNGGMTCEKTGGLNFPLLHSHGTDHIPGCIQHITPDGTVSTLYSHCNGHPLVAPNDLVFDSYGGFYFTDSGEPEGRTTSLGGLYYAKADGSAITELIHEPTAHLPLSQPNGCGLSLDGKTIYVSETVSRSLWAWDILAPGVLDTAPRAFVPNGGRFVYGPGGRILFDSLAVDGAGNVCVATLVKGGISIVSPQGELVDFVATPGEQFSTNICFGGPGFKSAFVTAATTGRIFEIDWPWPGLEPNYWRLGRVDI
jgi:gluconolactonase